MKILVIEDDEKIVSAIKLVFQLAWPGTEIVSAEWGQEGCELTDTENPDLIILDLGLPDMDGLEVLKNIRAFSKIPILILTVNKDEMVLVQALELGANDFVNKPFRNMELLARAKKLIVKERESGDSSPVVFGAFFHDYNRRELVYKGKTSILRSIENEILFKLIKHAPDVVTYPALAEAVWGEDYIGAVDCLKVHVRHLRQKIEEDPSNPRVILTRSGVGYYLVKPE